MENEKKKLYFRITITIMLSLIVLMLIIFILVKIFKKEENNIINENKIPQIKEKYTSTNLKIVKKYNDYVFLNDKTNQIELTSDNKIILGEYGKLYDEAINESNEIKKTFCNNYKINNDNGSYTYESNGNKSDTFNMITLLYTDDECNYLLLQDKDKYYILNTTNEEINEIDEEINYFEEEKINNNNYIIGINQNNKYVLTDYKGNIKQNFTYDYIELYKDKYIIKKDNKYGIIDINKNEIQEIKYNNIKYINNYLLLIEKEKINIYYKDKLVTNINYKNIDIENGYILNESNDILYLSIISEDEPKTYVINNKKIINTIKGNISAIKNEENKIEYLYRNDNKDNVSFITFYDENANVYYDLYLDKYYEQVYISKIDETNYYKLICSNDTLNNDYYYVDLFNSKEVKEIDAIYKYFDNGYGFTLNDNNKLTIYKKKEIISTYDNIESYLGGYYFVTNNYNEEEDHYDTNIYKIIFKNES